MAGTRGACDGYGCTRSTNRCRCAPASCVCACVARACEHQPDSSMLPKASSPLHSPARQSPVRLLPRPLASARSEHTLAPPAARSCCAASSAAASPSSRVRRRRCRVQCGLAPTCVCAIGTRCVARVPCGPVLTAPAWVLHADQAPTKGQTVTKPVPLRPIARPWVLTASRVVDEEGDDVEASPFLADRKVRHAAPCGLPCCSACGREDHQEHGFGYKLRWWWRGVAPLRDAIHRQSLTRGGLLVRQPRQSGERRWPQEAMLLSGGAWWQSGLTNPIG